LAVLVVAACGDNRSEVFDAPAPAVFSFEKRTLDTAFRGEAVAVFDVDRDGMNDLVTDQFWYRGPEFAPIEIRTPETFDVNAYSDCVGAWGDDIDADGWTDVVVAPYAADAMYWYRNPQGTGHWTPQLVAPPLSAGMEMPIYVDLFGDGRRVAVMGIEDPGVVAWFEPGASPSAPWVSHAISATGFGGAYRYAHGLGIGDVDGDGRSDVLTTTAWFQQTADRTQWLMHPLELGPDPCSTMFAHDFDGNGRADLLCAHPHTYGLDLWRQQDDGTFRRHPIDRSISQMHSLLLVDLDGDGAPEIVSGKNFRAHPLGYGDPGDNDPVVLAVWKVRADAGHLTVERHIIDDDSGVGRLITAEDVDRDGLRDLVIASKKGLFLFVQRPSPLGR
jgi:hypothetical protein